MILVIGGLGAGKRAVVTEYYGYGSAEMSAEAAADCPVLYDLQQLAQESTADVAELAALVAAKEIIICTEIGCGLVPQSPEERAAREKTGRLCQLLAARAETVVRVYCGLPQAIKGSLPCKSA